jgi:PAS domain S-box-containing protein
MLEQARPTITTSPGIVERALREGACALGPMDAWPPALRYAARFLFDSGSPTFLAWGAEGRLLVNDACLPHLARHRPDAPVRLDALGQALAQAWPALWEALQPVLPQVLAGAALQVEPPGLGAGLALAPLRDLDGTVCGIRGTLVHSVTVDGRDPQFRAIADAIPHMVWSTLPDGRHDYFSQRWYDFTGVQPGASDGESWSDMVHQEDRARAWEVWRHSLATGVLYEIEYRLRHASGEYRWTLARALPVRDDAGRIVRWLGTCTETHEHKANQAALHDARLRQDAALVAADIGTWTYDIRADRIYADRNLAAIFGTSDAAAAAGASLAQYLDAIHPDDLHGARTAIAATIACGLPFEQQYRVRAADGGWRHVLARAKLTYGEDGQPAWMPGVVLDITRQREVEDALRASETRFRRLADSNVIGILRYRLDGSIIDANQSFLDMLGYSRADVEHGRLSSSLLTPPEWVEANRRVMAQLRATGRMDNHIKEYYRKDGSRVSVQMGATMVDSCEGIAYVVDISPIRDAQQALARSEAQLREADQRKDEFLAMLAHELRNPLAPIAAAADFLTIGKPDPAQLREVTAVIARQASHMTGLIDDLLDVSRVTRGQVTLNRAPVAIAVLVAEALEQVRPLVEAKGHALALDVALELADDADDALAYEAVLVNGDRKRLVQVFANLLGNAAKYTPDGGQIGVRVAVHDDEIEVEVVDDGIGMSAHLLARAFELFSQGERSADRSQGGLGVGLALARSLVELHGGRVRAASDGPGRGSRFSVSLPRLRQQPAAEVPHDSEPAAAPAAAPLQVLIVDDNVDAAQILAMYIEALGHRADVLHSPSEALARLQDDKRARPDLCVLDIGLPEFDGYELAARLRAIPGLDGLPLVALSGYGQAQDKEKALAAGFDRHVVKPIQGSDVMELLAGAERARKTAV